MFSYCTVQINCSHFSKAFNVYHPVHVVVLPLDEPAVCLSCALSTDLHFLSCINVISIVESWLNFVFYYSKKKNICEHFINFLSTERNKESLLSDDPFCAAPPKPLCNNHVPPKMNICWKLTIGHPRCRWVCFFIKANLDKCSVTLLTNGSSAVNGCRQNESQLIITIIHTSPAVNILWRGKLVRNKSIIETFKRLLPAKIRVLYGFIITVFITLSN